jgi:hypothetical protein
LQVGLREDALAFVVSLAVLVPAAVLVSFRAGARAQPALVPMAAAAAALAVQASSLLLSAVAIGAAALLLGLLFGAESDRPWRGSTWLFTSSLLLAWAGAVVDEQAGTDVYAAIPVTALSAAAFALVALAAVVASGLVPWRPWLAQDWMRGSPLAAPVAAATMFPVGFYLLLRAFDLGQGRYPSVAFNVALGVLGALVAAASALRAQAAPDRVHWLAECLPGLGGAALVGIGFGTVAGLSAAVTLVLAAAMLAGLAPLVPTGDLRWALATAVVVGGAPPTLVFGGRLMALQAGLESSAAGGFLALALLLLWLVVLAAGARLPYLPGSAAGRPSILAAATLLAAALVAGAALGPAQAALAFPAASEVLGAAAGRSVAAQAGITMASGAWPALAVAVPLLLVAAGLVLSARGLPAEPRRRVPMPPPLLSSAFADRARNALRSAAGWRVPATWGIPSPAAVERAAQSDATIWVPAVAAVGAAVFYALR